MFSVQESEALLVGYVVAVFLLNSGRIRKAIELFKECLLHLADTAIARVDEQLVRSMYECIHFEMFDGYISLNDFANAVECGRELLVLVCQSGDRDQEGMVYFKLGKLHFYQHKCQEAKTFFEMALNIMRETGSIQGEGSCYGNLGMVFNIAGENVKAKEYLEKALSIAKKLHDRRGEAVCYGNLGNVFTSRGNFVKAKEYYEKALTLRQEIGYRENEALCYANLGDVCISLGKNGRAKEHLEKGLEVAEESDDRMGKAFCYKNLGTLLMCHDKAKAKEYYEKALAIAKEIGDKQNEASCTLNLGAVSYDLGKYAEAKEYVDKALDMAMESFDREMEVACYVNLGTLFGSFGNYAEAKGSFEKALAISKETGDKKSEATSLLSLGALYRVLGDYSKCKDYLEKSLTITQQIGARNEEFLCYGELGNLFNSPCKYEDFEQATESYNKQLEIANQIGSKDMEASSYLNLGKVSCNLGEHAMAKEYLEEAVSITQLTADRNVEARCYARLGTVLHFLGEYTQARECLDKALAMSKEAGDTDTELSVISDIAMTLVLEGKIAEAISYLSDSIEKFENIRSCLKEDIENQLRISLFDQYIIDYRVLGALFCITKNPLYGFYVVETGRARALADLMSSKYCVENEISFNEQLWAGVERFMNNGKVVAYLYISYFVNSIFLWVFKEAGKLIRFQEVDINNCLPNSTTKGAELKRKVDDVFDRKAFENLRVSAGRGQCEDRSWFPTHGKQQARKDKIARDIQEEDRQTQQQLSPTLADCYKMFIQPIADYLYATEIIIVPDRCLFKVPFPALKDEEGKYLSESFRILIVPSVTTLRLIKESPADYHSQTGALIVGNPDVGKVRYKGRLKRHPPLLFAEEEAEMIGGLLEIQPLLGKEATKQAVLQSITSVSLVHFAAHGDAERGEIILAPPHPFHGIPQEEDYLLTMADISKVRLRAKLVVLSCCHSADGQVSAEGVVGIAHAFLGSGARSVLVALWAIDDKATKKLMSCFYEHLIRGESASESLHQAMKWMRENGFSDVVQWAPFMLIGDNVTFDFNNFKYQSTDYGKQKQYNFKGDHCLDEGEAF